MTSSLSVVLGYMGEYKERRRRGEWQALKQQPIASQILSHDFGMYAIMGRFKLCG